MHYNVIGAENGKNDFNCHSGTTYEVWKIIFSYLFSKFLLFSLPLFKSADIFLLLISVFQKQLRYIIIINFFKVVVTPGDPNSFLSCGEDGTVRLFDLRTKTKCQCHECAEVC